MSTSYPLQTTTRSLGHGFFTIALLISAVMAVMLVALSVGGTPDLSLYGTAFP